VPGNALMVARLKNDLKRAGKDPLDLGFSYTIE